MLIRFYDFEHALHALGIEELHFYDIPCIVLIIVLIVMGLIHWRLHKKRQDDMEDELEKSLEEKLNKAHNDSARAYSFDQDQNQDS